jgi:hypothetical protein
MASSFCTRSGVIPGLPSPRSKRVLAVRWLDTQYASLRSDQYHGPTRYVAVYGRRRELHGMFDIRVATGCTPPKQDEADWDTNFTTVDDSDRRLRLPGGNGHYVNDDQLLNDDQDGKITACIRVFAGDETELLCRYRCDDGFDKGGDIRCIVTNNSLPGTLTVGTCTRYPQQ